MEAIRAKDRATAKKIVRKMEERAKRRAKDNTGKAAKSIEPIRQVGENQHALGGCYKIENITPSDRGTSSAYRLGKIKRDHPELAEQGAEVENSPVRAPVRAPVDTCFELSLGSEPRTCRTQNTIKRLLIRYIAVLPRSYTSVVGNAAVTVFREIDHAHRLLCHITLQQFLTSLLWVTA